MGSRTRTSKIHLTMLAGELRSPIEKCTEMSRLEVRSIPETPASNIADSGLQFSLDLEWSRLQWWVEVNMVWTPRLYMRAGLNKWVWCHPYLHHRIKVNLVVIFHDTPPPCWSQMASVIVVSLYESTSMTTTLNYQEWDCWKSTPLLLYSGGTWKKRRGD